MSTVPPRTPLEEHPDRLHAVDDAVLFRHTKLPDTRLSRALDAILAHTGRAFSWLWLGVVGVILYSVISRYVFDRASVMMEEVQWHLAGMAWLVGLSYTLVEDNHVRVDVLHERMSLKTRAWIELLGLLLLLAPFLLIALSECSMYFWSSFEQNEKSPAPGGLPARWTLKFFLPLTFFLLTIAAFSRLLRCTALLFGFPKPLSPEGRAETKK